MVFRCVLQAEGLETNSLLCHLQLLNKEKRLLVKKKVKKRKKIEYINAR